MPVHPLRVVLSDGTEIQRIDFQDASGKTQDVLDFELSHADDDRSLVKMVHDRNQKELFGEARPTVAELAKAIAAVMARNNEFTMRLEVLGSAWGTDFRIYPPHRHPEVRVLTA